MLFRSEGYVFVVSVVDGSVDHEVDFYGIQPGAGLVG